MGESGIFAPGNRVSIRYRDADGRPTDVVGEVLAADDQQLTVLPWAVPERVVERSAITHARPVPPRAVRPASPAGDLARLAAHGWPGLRQQRLGGWVLRMSGGGSRRANSALAAGDPGVQLAEAIDAVQGSYQQAGLRPAIQVLDADHPLDAELERRGWQPEGDTTLMVADLRRLPQPASTGEAARLIAAATWSTAPDRGWLDAEHPGDPARAAETTAAPAHYLTVPGPDGPAAVARLWTGTDWAGVSNVWVDPALRGRGLGRAVMEEVIARALASGVRFGYLQVVQGNAVARSLYDSMGWLAHHDYRYRTLG